MQLLVLGLRAFILYLVVFFAVRIMGKRELGQLQPFEFVAAILIADLVATPMSNTGVPIFYGIIPILILLLTHLFISLFSLKNSRFRNMICGVPTIIINNGVVDETAMRKIRYNLNDLIEQLREKSIFSVADVQFAILETSGKLSVLPRACHVPLTPAHMSIQPPPSTLPHTVILDGTIDKRELFSSGLNEEELFSLVKKQGCKSIKEVFLATVDSHHNMYLQKKERFFKR